MTSIPLRHVDMRQFPSLAKPRRKNKYSAELAWRCKDCGCALSSGEVDNGKPCPDCDSKARLRFDSRREARRYDELLRDQKLEMIADLELQPRFPLVVNGKKVSLYLADFRYRRIETGKTVVEDVKGTDTPVSKLKRKLVAALYDVTVEIIK